jgi:2-oxoglutarate ferredoxin oxidoreductase subunit beta
VVEILSPCPTHFGRRNKLGTASDMLEHLKENTTPVGSKAKQETPSLIERGVFVDRPDVPEYCSAYERTVELAHKG